MKKKPTEFFDRMNVMVRERELSRITLKYLVLGSGRMVWPSFELGKPVERASESPHFSNRRYPSSLITEVKKFEGIRVLYNPLLSPGLAHLCYALLDSMATDFYNWLLRYFNMKKASF